MAGSIVLSVGRSMQSLASGGLVLTSGEGVSGGNVALSGGDGSASAGGSVQIRSGSTSCVVASGDDVGVGISSS